MKYNTIEQIIEALEYLKPFEEIEANSKSNGWYPRRSGRTTKTALRILLLAQDNEVALCYSKEYSRVGDREHSLELAKQVIGNVKFYAQELGITIKGVYPMTEEYLRGTEYVIVHDHLQ